MRRRCGVPMEELRRPGKSFTVGKSAALRMFFYLLPTDFGLL